MTKPTNAMEAIRQLKAQGWLTTQIAAAIGCNHNTVAQWAEGKTQCRYFPQLVALLSKTPPKDTRGRPIGRKTGAKK